MVHNLFFWNKYGFANDLRTNSIPYTDKPAIASVTKHYPAIDPVTIDVSDKADLICLVNILGRYIQICLLSIYSSKVCN